MTIDMAILYVMSVASAILGIILGITSKKDD